ncbi:MAG TPA: BadF/BadG/BcrA/BcrD ATPase family protein [Solirubrobacteraceae bacterium]|nr:BadF/BadG/BcrA/BcrD ATPase family protein [Solirubrobacteraceae bacterium]
MHRDPLVTLAPALTDPVSPATAGGARHVLGIDGGATKTLAAVLDLRQRVLHLGHAGPSNEDAVGTRLAVKAVLDATDQALTGAGISHEQLAASVLAVAGTDTAAIERHLHDTRPERWIVVNDVVGAWATATGARPGVGVISGTGSNVFGAGSAHSPEGWVGRTWRAGGWGHLLGDEGSGYWLGAQSIVAALHDRDGSGPPTALSDALLEFFRSASVEMLAASVYTTPLTKGEVAAFAVETSRLAQEGDAVARELYARAAALLGAQIGAVIANTGLTGDFPVGLVGSAFRAGEVFVSPLIDAVHAAAPQARVFPVHMAPVGGSLLLALRACGCEGALSVQELGGLIEGAVAAE